MNFPPELVLNILSFIDCLRLNKIQLVCHQFRTLIPLIHKKHQCAFSIWLQKSKLIQSKFKKSKFCQNTIIDFIFFPQYGCSISISEQMTNKLFYYFAEISDYLNRKFLLKTFHSKKKLELNSHFDPIFNSFSISFCCEFKLVPIYFNINLQTLRTIFSKECEIWYNEMDNYSEIFGSLSCDFVSSCDIITKGIQFLGQKFPLNVVRMMEWGVNQQITSPDGKWLNWRLCQGLYRGILHIYHFENFADLWLFVIKMDNQDDITLFLYQLNEKSEMIKLCEITYHTLFVCPVYCSHSNAVFILSDFKNRVKKIYQF